MPGIAEGAPAHDPLEAKPLIEGELGSRLPPQALDRLMRRVGAMPLVRIIDRPVEVAVGLRVSHLELAIVRPPLDVEPLGDAEIVILLGLDGQRQIEKVSLFYGS